MALWRCGTGIVALCHRGALALWYNPGQNLTIHLRIYIIVVGVVILLLLCRLMVVGKILIFENLGVGTLPTPPN